VSKLAAERYCVSFSRVYALETVALRYFNVFGPNQDPTSQYSAVIPRFVTAIARGHRITIYGDGNQRRDFTYVDNVVDANVVAAEAEGANGLVLNVATGRSTSVNELANMIGQLLGRPVGRDEHPPRAGDVRDSWADIARAGEVFGWKPRVSLEAGLALASEAFLRRSIAD
jgi:UDP-glucose 4-epimerase